jgi:hypothetical protein
LAASVRDTMTGHGAGLPILRKMQLTPLLSLVRHDRDGREKAGHATLEDLDAKQG